jgi:hypothetical protein
MECFYRLASPFRPREPFDDPSSTLHREKRCRIALETPLRKCHGISPPPPQLLSIPAEAVSQAKERSLFAKNCCSPLISPSIRRQYPVCQNPEVMCDRQCKSRIPTVYWDFQQVFYCGKSSLFKLGSKRSLLERLRKVLTPPPRC